MQKFSIKKWHTNNATLELKLKCVLLSFVELDTLGIEDLNYPRTAYFMSKGEEQCDFICVDKSMSRIVVQEVRETRCCRLSARQ